jgi:predicted ATPase
VDTAYVTAVSLRSGTSPGSGYPWDLPAIRALAHEIRLHPNVTYLIGENGSGKSTLLEAIAVASGMNAEGGSSNFSFSTRESHSNLWAAMRLVRGVYRPATDFFLRAESLFTAATYLEGLGPNSLRPYGGVSLHEQSHGESFLAVMINRFDPNGFYLLDGPRPRSRPRTASPACGAYMSLSSRTHSSSSRPTRPSSWPIQMPRSTRLMMTGSTRWNTRTPNRSA